MKGPQTLQQNHGALRMLACYMDDSADFGKKTVFSVGAFVADTEKWFDVERYWTMRLEREGIDYFRTWDCIHLDGEFRTKLVDRHGLTTARVIADAILRDLKQLVATSDLYAYAFGVLMEDYRIVSNEPDGQVVLDEDPYIFAHQMLIGIILDDVCNFPSRRIIAFGYDEHSKATLLQNSWAGYKECNPNWAKSAGTLASLDDKVTVAIQVADLLAHTTTRTFVDYQRNSDGALDRLKGWLGGNLIRAPYANAEFLRIMVAGNVDRFKALGAKRGYIPILPPLSPANKKDPSML